MERSANDSETVRTHQDFVHQLLFVEQDNLAVETGHFVAETIDPHVEAEFPSFHWKIYPLTDWWSTSFQSANYKRIKKKRE